MPAAIHMRLAQPEEADLLRDVMLRCWTGTVAENSSAYRETEADIARQLERGGGVLVFAGDAAVGAGRFHPVPGPAGDPSEWVEIKRVGVLRSYRKLGLGAPLVAALEREAQRRGYAGAQLGVRHDQPRLIAFWTSLGYAPASDVKMHTINPLTPPPTTMRKRFEQALHCRVSPA
jgi:ribosomal protein S18 acetylase RimI-like enzyme